MKEIGTDSTPRELILRALRDGEKSQRQIEEMLRKEGHGMHRVMLSGYLRGLADAGDLKAREIKPFRLYSLASKEAPDVYDVVGRVAREVDEQTSGDSALLLLHVLFNRPVFLREVERCNVEPPVRFRRVNSPSRIRYIQDLQRLGVEIPRSNILIEPESIDPYHTIKLLRSMVDALLGIRKYSLTDGSGVQATLD